MRQDCRRENGGIQSEKNAGKMVRSTVQETQAEFQKFFLFVIEEYYEMKFNEPWKSS